MQNQIRIYKVIFTLLIIVGLASCKNSETTISKLEIAKTYYNILDNSNTSEITTLMSDSVVVRESEDNYEERFSKNGYAEWLQWDSVFKPTYKILKIEQEGETVKTKISKIDKRLLFLHEEPIVWDEILHFQNNKINRIERIKYNVFNVNTFLRNREKLINWIDKNQTELNGFLDEQTKLVGQKYLKAIQLYSSENNQ